MTTNSLKEHVSARSWWWYAVPWLMCGLAAVFYCYEYILRVFPSVMLPQLMQSFKMDAAGVGYIAAYYYHAYTPMQIPVGFLMDRFGARRLLTIACLICAVGSLIFARTEVVWVAKISRFLVGFGSAFAFIGVLKLARGWLPVNRFAMMSGITSMLGIVGALVGFNLVGALVRSLGWQDATWWAAIAGIILAIIIAVFVRNHDPHERHRLLPERVTSADELTSDLKELLLDPRMWAIGIIGCLLYLPTSCFAELWGTLYFQQAKHLTPHESELAVSTIFIGWGICAPFAGLISDRIANRLMPLFLGALLTAGVMGILFYGPALSKGMLFGLLFLLGAFYSVQVVVFAYACDIAPERASGTALAFINMLVMLGGSVFQPLVGKLLASHVTNPLVVDNVHYYAEKDYQFAFASLPLGLLLAMGLVLLLKEPKKHYVVG